MASDCEASCVGDPNFAVICNFLEKFGTLCGITSPDFYELQEMLENHQEVSPELIDLHVKLLRRARRAVSGDRWERALIKFCHMYCDQDAWELERFGYKKARLMSKLRILKTLLEMQFDLNQKFKLEVNRQTAKELRTEPVGRDKHGYSYWYQVDEQCQVRVYREDPDEETWVLIAKDRDGLVQLISQLCSDDPASRDLALNEDSNSLELEKPIIDTGQVSSNSPVKTEDDDSPAKTEDDDSPANVDNAVIEEVKSEPIIEEIKEVTQPEVIVNEIANLKEVIEEKIKPEVLEVKKSEPVGIDLRFQKAPEPSRGVDLTSKRKKSINDLAADLRIKSQDMAVNSVQEQEIDLSMKTARVSKPFSSLSVPPFDPISIESALRLTTNFTGEDELDDSDEIDLPSHMKQPRLARPKLLENKKAKSYSEEDEFDDEIEEPLMMVRGEGSGRDCDSENVQLEEEYGEAIEEPVMMVFGEGSGHDCDTGNTGNGENDVKTDVKAEKSESSVQQDVSTNLELRDSISNVAGSAVNSGECVHDQDNVTSSSGSEHLRISVKNVLDTHKTDSLTNPHQTKIGKVVFDMKSDSFVKSPLKKLSRWDIGRPSEASLGNKDTTISLEHLDVLSADSLQKDESLLQEHSTKSSITSGDGTENPERVNRVDVSEVASTQTHLVDDEQISDDSNRQEVNKSPDQLVHDEQDNKTPAKPSQEPMKPPMFFFGPGCVSFKTTSTFGLKKESETNEKLDLPKQTDKCQIDDDSKTELPITGTSTSAAESVDDKEIFEKNPESEDILNIIDGHLQQLSSSKSLSTDKIIKSKDFDGKHSVVTDIQDLEAELNVKLGDVSNTKDKKSMNVDSSPIPMEVDTSQNSASIDTSDNNELKSNVEEQSKINQDNNEIELISIDASSDDIVNEISNQEDICKISEDTIEITSLESETNVGIAIEKHATEINSDDNNRIEKLDSKDKSEEIKESMNIEDKNLSSANYENSEVESGVLVKPSCEKTNLNENNSVDNLKTYEIELSESPINKLDTTSEISSEKSPKMVQSKTVVQDHNQINEESVVQKEDTVEQKIEESLVETKIDSVNDSETILNAQKTVSSIENISEENKDKVEQNVSNTKEKLMDAESEVIENSAGSSKEEITIKDSEDEKMDTAETSMVIDEKTATKTESVVETTRNIEEKSTVFQQEVMDQEVSTNTEESVVTDELVSALSIEIENSTPINTGVKLLTESEVTSTEEIGTENKDDIFPTKEESSVIHVEENIKISQIVSIAQITGESSVSEVYSIDKSTSEEITSSTGEKPTNVENASEIITVTEDSHMMEVDSSNENDIDSTTEIDSNSLKKDGENDSSQSANTILEKAELEITDIHVETDNKNMVDTLDTETKDICDTENCTENKGTISEVTIGDVKDSSSDETSNLGNTDSSTDCRDNVKSKPTVSNEDTAPIVDRFTDNANSLESVEKMNEEKLKLDENISAINEEKITEVETINISHEKSSAMQEQTDISSNTEIKIVTVEETQMTSNEKLIKNYTKLRTEENLNTLEYELGDTNTLKQIEQCEAMDLSEHKTNTAEEEEQTTRKTDIEFQGKSEEIFEKPKPFAEEESDNSENNANELLTHGEKEREEATNTIQIKSSLGIAETAGSPIEEQIEKESLISEYKLQTDTDHTPDNKDVDLGNEQTEETNKLDNLEKMQVESSERSPNEVEELNQTENDISSSQESNTESKEITSEEINSDSIKESEISEVPVSKMDVSETGSNKNDDNQNNSDYSNNLDSSDTKPDITEQHTHVSSKDKNIVVTNKTKIVSVATINVTEKAEDLSQTNISEKMTEIQKSQNLEKEELTDKTEINSTTDIETQNNVELNLPHSVEIKEMKIEPEKTSDIQPKIEKCLKLQNTENESSKSESVEGSLKNISEQNIDEIDTNLNVATTEELVMDKVESNITATRISNVIEEKLYVEDKLCVDKIEITGPKEKVTEELEMVQTENEEDDKKQTISNAEPDITDGRKKLIVEPMATKNINIVDENTNKVETDLSTTVKKQSDHKMDTAITSDLVLKSVFDGSKVSIVEHKIDIKPKEINIDIICESDKEVELLIEKSAAATLHQTTVEKIENKIVLNDITEGKHESASRQNISDLSRGKDDFSRKDMLKDKKTSNAEEDLIISGTNNLKEIKESLIYDSHNTLIKSSESKNVTNSTVITKDNINKTISETMEDEMKITTVVEMSEKKPLKGFVSESNDVEPPAVLVESFVVDLSTDLKTADINPKLSSEDVQQDQPISNSEDLKQSSPIEDSQRDDKIQNLASVTSSDVERVSTEFNESEIKTQWKKVPDNNDSVASDDSFCDLGDVGSFGGDSPDHNSEDDTPAENDMVENPKVVDVFDSLSNHGIRQSDDKFKTYPEKNVDVSMKMTKRLRSETNDDNTENESGPISKKLRIDIDEVDNDVTDKTSRNTESQDDNLKNDDDASNTLDSDKAEVKPQFIDVKESAHKPLLMCVNISKLTDQADEPDVTVKSTILKSPEHTPDESVITIENDDSNDAFVAESDPLACTEEDILMAQKTEEAPKQLSLSTWKLDETIETPIAAPITRSLRNRQIRSDPLVPGKRKKSDIEEIDSARGKKRKTRGRRAVNVSLRKSVEEQKKRDSSSSEEEKDEKEDERLEPPAVAVEQKVTPRRGWPRGRGRRGRGRGGRVSRTVNESPALSSDAQSETSRNETIITPPSAKVPARKKKTNRVLGLDLDPEVVMVEKPPEETETNARGTSVRQSRRIAQIKIKEEAERRKIQEYTLLDMKEEHRKKKKKKDDDKEYKESNKKKKSKNDSEDDSADEMEEVYVKKHKKKKRKLQDLKRLFDMENPWQSSSESSSSNEEEEELEVEEPSDEEVPFLKSDHEFSPESDLENTSEVQPLKRARTVKKESDSEDPVDDHACQKCNKSDHPEWILLCDSCDCGWHCSCLRPALFVIPEGDWFCPPCQHISLINSLKAQLVEYDKKVNKHEMEVRRKQRLAYVGISLDNVLPAKEQDPHKIMTARDESDSESEDSSSSSDSSSGDESEPIYQLRERRQAHSYRFNDYDELINSAIQDELEAVKGAGNQGRGKDIATIVNAEKEEQAQALLQQQQQQQQQQLVEPPPPVVPVYSKPEVPEPEDKSDEDSNEATSTTRRLSAAARKKHRKLNSLDVSSEDDDDDEDFKGTSEEEEEEFEDDLGSDDSDDMDIGRRGRRRREPIRRSTRAKITRYDREFINDNSEDEVVPRKKKSKSMWDESESEDSDKSWGRRKQNKKRYSSPKIIKKSRKKKKKKSNDNDPDEVKIPKEKKRRIKYGGLDEESDDEVLTRRTRGKKINYLDALASDSDEEIKKHGAKPIESEEEYVANEEEDEDEILNEENVKDIEESESESEKVVPKKIIKLPKLMQSPKHLKANVPMKIGLPQLKSKMSPQLSPTEDEEEEDDEDEEEDEPEELDITPDEVTEDVDEEEEEEEETPPETDIPVIAANPEGLDEEEVGMMMEEEEYANKQLELMAIQLAKEKKRKEKEAKKLEKLEKKEIDDSKKKGHKKKRVDSLEIPMLQPEVTAPIPSLTINTALLNKTLLSKSMEKDDEMPVLESEVLPTVINEMPAAPPKRRGRGKAAVSSSMMPTTPIRNPALMTMPSGGSPVKVIVPGSESSPVLPLTPMGSAITMTSVSQNEPILQAGKLGIAAPPQPFSQNQPTPSVITRMLQSQPISAQTFTSTANALGQKYFNAASEQPRAQFPPMAGRGRVPSPYRQSPPMNHYQPMRNMAPGPQQRLRNPASMQMFHAAHHPMDPSPSGGGPIVMSANNRDRNSPAIPPPVSSPLAPKGNPTPPPPPYSRTTMSSRFSPSETNPGPSLQPVRHMHFPNASGHMQSSSPPRPPTGNFSPYHPPPPPNYHYGAYPPPPSLTAADDALPPTAYQNSPYPEHYNPGDSLPPIQSEGSNSKFDEEGSGEFGGLVSYFSSQREDDLDT